MWCVPVSVWVEEEVCVRPRLCNGPRSTILGIQFTCTTSV
jgi:hypothetical protein